MYYYELRKIVRPEWGKAGRIHDWRNYVDTEYKLCWPVLSKETKVAIFRMADRVAGREEWD